MPSVARAVELKRWLEFPENMFQVASAFNSTSRFARLSALKVNLAGPYVYIRFKSTTGDAMGMNMISKGRFLAQLYFWETRKLIESTLIIYRSGKGISSNGRSF